MDSLTQETTKHTRPVQGPGRSRRPLRLLTFLAPNLLWFYQFLGRYLAKKLRYPTELCVGSDYAQLPEEADLAFVCGLPYVELARHGKPPIEPLVAPVLQGARYGGQPIYFSDVIVRCDSPCRSFADLRGCSWAFNEPHSQSGYGITRFHLASRGETAGYFSRVVQGGWHERALEMVCAGEVDGAAIDSHVLAIAMQEDRTLPGRLRVVEVLGPSPIQPIVVSRHLPASLKEDLRSILLGMAEDAEVKTPLKQALVERFVAVSDAGYDEIRCMVAVAEAADFLTLR